MSPSPSVLLVEMVTAARFAAVKALMYPFISGYLAQSGIPVRWLCVARETQPATAHPFVIDLDDRTRARLVSLASEAGATHLLLSERPSVELDRFLERRLPGIARQDLSTPERFLRSRERAWLAGWLGLPGPRDGWLPDLCEPRYGSAALAAPLAGPPPPVTVTAGNHCLYGAPLEKNPHFRDLDLGSLTRDFGCAFCPGEADLRYPFETRPLALVLRQIRAAAEADGVHSRRDFVIQSARAFRQIDSLIDGLGELGVGPSRLYFSCRADELLVSADRLERVLPRARELGHELHIWSLGVENFSPAENERLNKGIAIEQVHAALDRLADWERRFPDHFGFSANGGLGFILFTPWTTLGDLRLNLAAARKLAIAEQGFFLTRRLLLLPGAATTRLAGRDGLLAGDDREAREAFSWLARHCDPGCQFWPEDEDTPWRFRDPRAAAVCAIAVRLAGPDEPEAGDPHHPRIRRLVRGVAQRTDLLGLFEWLLDAATQADEPVTVASLLDDFEARLSQELPADSAPPVSQGPGDSLDAPELAATYRAAFRRLAEHPEDPLRGFALADLALARRRVTLEFRRGGERLRLFVQPHDEGTPCRLRRGELAFSFDEATPLDTGAKRDLFGQVVSVFAGRRPRVKSPRR